MSGPILVIVDAQRKQPRYTRFEGRRLTHQFEYLVALSAFWVEEIRRAPEQFEAAVEKTE